MENFEDNIEKEYHERFHDFEEMPDDALWAKIQERITPESERRPVVFWWQTFRMGIAASLLIGLLLGAYYFSTFSPKKEIQVRNIPSNTIPLGEIKATESTPKNQLIEPTNPVFTQRIQEKKEEKNIELSGKIEQNLEKLEQKQVFEEVKNKVVLLENAIVEKKFSENVIVSKQVELPKKEEAITVEVNEISTANSSEKVVGNTEKLVLNNEVESPKIANSDFKEAQNQAILSKNLNQDMFFLESKKVNIPQNEISINLPELNSVEPEIAFEEAPKRRLVFIPPTEFFINIKPTLSYYIFSPNNGDNILVKDFNPQRLSFSAQIGFVYPIAKKLDLRTGISILVEKSAISYNQTLYNYRKVKIIDALNIEVEPQKNEVIEQKNWKYLEINSDFIYHITRTHALSLGFCVGVQTNTFRNQLFYSRLGYRVSKPISNRLAFWLEPSISFSLSPRNSAQNLFLYRTTGFGLNMGVSLLRHY